MRLRSNKKNEAFQKYTPSPIEARPVYEFRELLVYAFSQPGGSVWQCIYTKNKRILKYGKEEYFRDSFDFHFSVLKYPLI